MGAADELLFLAGGRLIQNPADTTSAPNYGGTVLGTIQAFAIERITRSDGITGEEFGGELVDSVYLGEEIIVTAELRVWDVDGLTAFFPNIAAGTGTIPNISYPGTIEAGDLWTDKGSVLMYVPDDVTAHPALVVFNALPIPEDSQQLTFSHFDDLFVDITFVGVRNAANKVYVIADLQDIAL